MRQSVRAILAVTVAILLGAAAVDAFAPKEPRDQLDMLAFQALEVRVVETNADAQAIRDQVPNIEAIDQFRAAYGGAWRVTLDQRRGVPTLVGGGAIPFMPGGANDLAWDAVAQGCQQNSCIPVSAVEPLARDFLRRWQAIFQVKDDELVLDHDGSGPFGHMYYLRFQWQVHGIPVERGSVFFRINRGNLIQVATTNIAPMALDWHPSLDSKQARTVVSDFLGPFGGAGDAIVDKGSLLILPVTPAGMDPDHFDQPYAAGLTYRLAWRFAFQRTGVIGTWEALVDAHSGELLRFVDVNRYGRVHGGAYPRDGHTGEADRPFAFVDIGGGQYADGGGLFPGDDATVTLQGRYAWVDDACGAVNGTTTSGDVDFLTGPDGQQDCAVPDGNTAGPGNTHSARTQYYNVTAINTKARSFLPSNDWLNNSHMNINTNGSPWCNATSGGGSINFFQSASGCWNLGELPAVSLHEWGHSMDDFDGSGGDSPPVETRADWTAMLQTHDSCVGRGFFLSGNCSGYGDACLDCGGVRDNDWTMHVGNTPWTPANHGTFWDCGGGGSYNGPCGLEDHCESGLSSQALWDFVTSDAVGAPTNLDLATAWALADRLFYLAMPTLGNMYSCSLPNSDGCNGGGLYATMTAIDDDGDGTANGTPHAAAIFAALDRHNIACGAAGDPQNQNETSCPALAQPVITLEAGSNAATVNWDPVTNAQRYVVFRNDVGCDAGFTKIGEGAAPATSLVDTTVVNGIPYYYRVQAVTDTDSCASLMSECAEVTPQPCAGAVSLDRATYSCDSVVTVRVVDSDLTGAANLDVTAWSDSEPTPETISLVESPADSGIFIGSFATTTDTTGGDGAVGVTHDDAITVRYHDDSYCGPPQDVDAGAFADCVPPVISGTATANVTGFSADVDWLTDEPADSRVDYDVVLESSVADDTFVTDHGLRLQPLAECTEYSYAVTSTDPAGNMATDDNGGAGYTFRTFKNTMPTYTADDTPVPIPDDTPPGATSVITVADDKPVVDLDVHVDITHTYDGDLSLHLMGPNGTEIVLSNRHGSTGDNYTGTVFDDEAATPISSGSAPFTGSFQPDDALSTFDGVTAAGDWTLRVEDHAGIDTGSIVGFALTFTFAAEECPTSDGWIDLDKDIYGCNATITIRVQDQDLEGDGTLGVTIDSDTETTPEDVLLSEIAPGVFETALAATSLPPSHGDGALSIATGDLITAYYTDADTGAGGHDVLKTDVATGDCDGPSITNVSVSGETGHTALVSWTTSEAADTTVVWDPASPPTTNTWHDDAMVTDHQALIEGLDACSTYWFYPESTDIYGNTVSDTNTGAYWRIDTVAEDGVEQASTDTPIAINDSSTFTSVIPVSSSLVVADVNVRLNITHTYDGDLDIFLIGPDGTEVELTTDNGGTGENFDDTVFDDEAATPITAGSAPFAGSYQPEGSLATLNGLAATGDWTLRVTDDAGGDTGTLNSWSILLTLAGGSCEQPEIFSDDFETGDSSAWSGVSP